MRVRQFGLETERTDYPSAPHWLMVSGRDRLANECKRGFRVRGAEGISLDQADKAIAWLGEVDDST